MIMPRWFSNSLKWAVGIGAASLAACSIHPIPDDVSRYSTADIIRNVRCEAKDAVRERIRQALHERGIYDVVPDNVLDPKSLAKIRRRDARLAAKFKAYGASTITYEFLFDITETNDATGGVTFGMPFTTGGQFSLPFSGQLKKVREGKRTINSVETFAGLAKLPCEGWVKPERDMLYPLTGSVGVGRIITTFINISEMGTQDLTKASADEKVFKDVLTFTTTVGETATPTLKLTPVPDRFRLTDATITNGNTRVDMHQVTITLLFPDLEDLREAIGSGAASDLSSETEVRARQNSCVAAERAREDRFGMLRRTPPAIYCRPNYIGEPVTPDDVR
jgi:hypothetical protein